MYLLRTCNEFAYWPVSHERAGFEEHKRCICGGPVAVTSAWWNCKDCSLCGYGRTPPYWCQAKPLRQLHWLPVRQRILFKVAVLTRKAHTTGTPTYLSQHLHQRTATYSTRSSSFPLLTVPNPSTVFTCRAFYYTAPTTWNSLPADILTCDSESHFKRLLDSSL